MASRHVLFGAARRFHAKYGFEYWFDFAPFVVVRCGWRCLCHRHAAARRLRFGFALLPLCLFYFVRTLIDRSATGPRLIRLISGCRLPRRVGPDFGALMASGAQLRIFGDLLISLRLLAWGARHGRRFLPASAVIGSRCEEILSLRDVDSWLLGVD